MFLLLTSRGPDSNVFFCDVEVFRDVLALNMMMLGMAAIKAKATSMIMRIMLSARSAGDIKVHCWRER